MDQLVERARRKARHQLPRTAESASNTQSLLMTSRKDLENVVLAQNVLTESLDEGDDDYEQRLAASGAAKLDLERQVAGLGSERPLAILVGASDERRDQILEPDLASSIPIPSAQGAVPPASPPPTQISDIASGQDPYDGREAQSSAHPWAPLLPGGSVPQSGCIDLRVITHTGSWCEQDHHNHRRGHQDTVCTASSSCSYKVRYGFH
jgi:hypothetical protein